MIWLAMIIHSPMFWLIFILGACIGSFLNVCILRVPEGTFLKNTRSVCPACGQMIPFWLNIPILAWFLLGGKAKCCRARLSFQYPLVELLSAMIFVYMYVKFPFLGWSVDHAIWNPQDALRFLHGVAFISILLVCSAIDLRYMIIPDVISLPMILLTPVVAWIHPDLDMKSALIGVVLGGGFLYGIAWLYWIVRKEYGMGFGDVKLLAGIGGWLGYQAIFPTLFVGSIVGSIIGVAVLMLGRKFSWQARIPFGPFLAIGAVIHFCWGPELFAWLAGG